MLKNNSLNTDSNVVNVNTQKNNTNTQNIKNKKNKNICNQNQTQPTVFAGLILTFIRKIG